MKKQGSFFLFKNKTLISLVMGLFVSGITLFFAFKNVPFNELWNYFKIIDYIWIFPAFVLLFAAYILKAFRWQIIVSSSHKISFKSAYHTLMIGFMINCVFPARAGEVARPVVLQKKDQVPFSTGLAAVAAERFFDLLFLLVFFVAVLANIEIDPGFEIKFKDIVLNKDTLESLFKGMVKISILLISGIIFISNKKARNLLAGLIESFPIILFFLSREIKEKIRIKICYPLINALESIASGFILMKSPPKIGYCIGLSIVIWTLNALSFYVFSKGCPGVSLSFIEMSAVMILICIFIALPSVPGFWGLWEAGGVFAMSLFAVSQKDAAGFTLVNHAIQVFPVIVLGGISAMVLGVNLFQVSREKRI